MAENYVVIIGCGRLGSLLAGHLSRLGNSVVIVDQNESAFAMLPGEFGGFQIHGDATELGVLRRAEIERATFLLATTTHDNVNLMVAQVAKKVFNVPTVIARVFNPAREKIYREFDIQVISPTQLSAEIFLQAMHIDTKDLHA